MNVKSWNDIVDWLISSGFLITVISFSWKYIKPWLDAKKLHAKTLQERELIGLVETLAESAVTSLVSNQDITGREKFDQATKMVANTVADKGFNVSDTTIQNAVQSAYEKSDLTPTVDPTVKPQTGVVVNG